MPEGPEVHLSAAFVKEVGKRFLFSGKVEKSAVSTKNPDIPWDKPLYRVAASARGKEMRITLSEENSEKKKKGSDVGSQLNILFRFGMSGKFELTERGKSHKHSHLKLFTSDGKHTLSFVDMRRFGRWEVTNEWSSKRGPCILTEFHLLSDHLKQLLDTSSLRKRPICEALLDQHLFNGIGNYLRAEILHRCGIPPFDPADEVLKSLNDDKCPEILKYVQQIPQEVMEMNKNFDTKITYMNDSDVSSGPEMSTFFAWLRCYGRENMETITDSHKRTVWFSGPPGPLVPKGSRSKRQSSSLKRKVKDAGDSTDMKEVKKEVTNSEIISQENSELNPDVPNQSLRPSRRKYVKKENGAGTEKKPKKRVTKGKITKSEMVEIKEEIEVSENVANMELETQVNHSLSKQSQPFKKEDVQFDKDLHFAGGGGVISHKKKIKMEPVSVDSDIKVRRMTRRISNEERIV